MRLPLIVVLGLLAATCGQKGPLLPPPSSMAQPVASIGVVTLTGARP